MLSVELPGRGVRYNEKLLTNLGEILDDIYCQVQYSLKTPYAIYGHSMGALLGYLLALKIKKLGYQPPLALLLSGHGAPGIRKERTERFKLSHYDFINEIRKLGGSPEEILNDEKLMLFFEPILRADFEAIETYRHQAQDRLSIPISILIGSQEDITDEEREGWRDVTDGPVKIHTLPGGHFFIFDHTDEVIKIIAQTIKLYGRRTILS